MGFCSTIKWVLSSVGMLALAVLLLLARGSTIDAGAGARMSFMDAGAGARMSLKLLKSSLEFCFYLGYGVQGKDFCRVSDFVLLVVSNNPGGRCEKSMSFPLGFVFLLNYISNVSRC